MFESLDASFFLVSFHNSLIRSLEEVHLYFKSSKSCHKMHTMAETSLISTDWVQMQNDSVEEEIPEMNICRICPKENTKNKPKRDNFHLSSLVKHFWKIFRFLITIA